MSIDLRDHLRKKYASTPVETGGPTYLTAEGKVVPIQATTASGLPNGMAIWNAPAALAPERAFVVHAKSGRTVITGPVREIAMANAGFTYLRGRFVEADTPNANGAMWTTADLELGQNTVAGGPLNWLHDDRQIIGTLMDGSLVAGREAAGSEPAIGNHIETTAAVWRFLFPKQVDAIEKAAADRGLYFSMECISRQVACVGDAGCGEQFDYADYDAGKTCSHLRERASIRRFVDPIFLGGAAIVPPIRPGWANAEADVVRQAAAAAEKAGLDDLTQAQATELASAVLQWANR